MSAKNELVTVAVDLLKAGNAHSLACEEYVTQATVVTVLAELPQEQAERAWLHLATFGFYLEV